MADDILPGRVATLAGATDVARALAETKLDLRWADEDDAAGLE